MVNWIVFLHDFSLIEDTVSGNKMSCKCKQFEPAADRGDGQFFPHLDRKFGGSLVLKLLKRFMISCTFPPPQAGFLQTASEL